MPKEEFPEWLDNDLICDLCGSPDPKWSVPANDVELGTIIAIGGNFPDFAETHCSVGDWAVCDDCVVLIRAEDRGGLLERCIQIFMTRYAFDRKTAEFAIRQVQAAFWSAKSGDPYYNADES